MVDNQITHEEAYQLIKNSSMRPSDYRIKILVLLKNNPIKSYSDIYKIIKSSSPTLSHTTVYNSIKAFKKAGLL